MHQPTRQRPAIARLILVPALVTLAVTLLRLIGELRGWMPTLFPTQPGGGFGLIGIAWLAPLFGIYFAMQLTAAGDWPQRPGRVVWTSLAGFAATIACFAAMNALHAPLAVMILTANVAFITVAAFAWRTWPSLGRTLLAYGVAARVPVLVVMALALAGHWGTHYDALPPNYASHGPLLDFILLALVPQLVLWVAYTILFGALFGGITAAWLARRQPGRAANV